MRAGLKWLKAHPEMYEKWLEGVTTVDGKPGAPGLQGVPRFESVNAYRKGG